MKVRWLAVALVLVATGCARCGSRSGGAKAVVDAGARPPRPAVDLEAFRARARVPALAAVAVTTADVVFEGAVGEADVARHVPATIETPFAAASLAKLVVAVCAARLFEEKRLSPGDDVSQLVGFPVRHPSNAKAPITLAMVLEHRSSLRDTWTELDVERDPAQGSTAELETLLRPYVARPAAWFPEPPAAAAHYANAGTALAALAMAKRTGESFEQLAERVVFAPLAMRSASWRRSPSTAVPHVAEAEGFRPVPLRDRIAFPASGLVVSAHDLARFARALLRGGELDGVRILGEDTTALLFLPSFGVQTIAFGDPAHRPIGHEGEDTGVSAALVVDPARATGAVVLANGDAFASNDVDRAHALSELIELLLATSSRAGTSL